MCGTVTRLACVSSKDCGWCFFFSFHFSELETGSVKLLNSHLSWHFRPQIWCSLLTSFRLSFLMIFSLPSIHMNNAEDWQQPGTHAWKHVTVNICAVCQDSESRTTEAQKLSCLILVITRFLLQPLLKTPHHCYPPTHTKPQCFSNWAPEYIAFTPGEQQNLTPNCFCQEECQVYGADTHSVPGKV